MTYARLTAVYGLSHSEISGMPLSAIAAYVDRIPAVLAERRLIAADGASVPWLKEPRRTLQAWGRIAYPVIVRQRAPLGILMLAGIGVERVTPPKELANG